MALAAEAQVNAAMKEAEAIADELLDERARKRKAAAERRAKQRATYPPKAKYWDGKPCEKHPGSPRYRSSSACVACQIERVAEWRLKRKGKGKP